MSPDLRRLLRRVAIAAAAFSIIGLCWACWPLLATWWRGDVVIVNPTTGQPIPRRPG